MSEQHILYSFRRCPWAMRARMALIYSGLTFELREVDLKNKPSAMLEASPKGTVPILIQKDGEVIDESWDIMQYAIAKNDPDHWRLTSSEQPQSEQLLGSYFKSLTQLIRHYKYPEKTSASINQTIDDLKKQLQVLEQLLHQHPFVITNQLKITDIALFPMIRQMIKVDIEQFESWDFSQLNAWYQEIQNSDLFEVVMEKHPIWVDNNHE